MIRHHHQLRAIMAIAIIVSAQALLAAHGFEHPVLDSESCTLCLYSHNASHAVTPTAVAAIISIVPAWFSPPSIIGSVAAHPIDSSIRAPPSSPAIT